MKNARDRMVQAATHARDSTDHPEKPVGAVVVGENGTLLALGANRFTLGIKNPVQRDLFIEHAERVALFACAAEGVKTAGGTMYLTWYPCAACARAIVECGIANLVCYRRPDYSDPKWGPDFDAATSILAHGNVSTLFLE